MSEVVEIDAKTATVARRWTAAPCRQPVANSTTTRVDPARRVRISSYFDI